MKYILDNNIGDERLFEERYSGWVYEWRLGYEERAVLYKNGVLVVGFRKKPTTYRFVYDLVNES